MNNDLVINDVTPEQSALLDIMWCFDNEKEMRVWQQCLPPHQQNMVDVLYEMLRLAVIDKEVQDSDLSLAKQLLEGVTGHDPTGN